MAERALPSQSKRKVSIEWTPEEIQTLTCAMAGKFPDGLNHLRPTVLRKLARAAVKGEGVMDDIVKEVRARPNSRAGTDEILQLGREVLERADARRL